MSTMPNRFLAGGYDAHVKQYRGWQMIQSVRRVRARALRKGWAI